MTLAGTRPILQDELLKYELHHRARIAIKPGITGMWQVSGRSDITDFEEEVVDRPKALGDIRGVTYIYGMFYQFGLIDVPDKVKEKMGRPINRKK